jgi:hypothetical protein
MKRIESSNNANIKHQQQSAGHLCICNMDSLWGVYGSCKNFIGSQQQQQQWQRLKRTTKIASPSIGPSERSCPEGRCGTCGVHLQYFTKQQSETEDVHVHGLTIRNVHWEVAYIYNAKMVIWRCWHLLLCGIHMPNLESMMSATRCRTERSAGCYKRCFRTTNAWCARLFCVPRS